MKPVKLLTPTRRLILQYVFSIGAIGVFVSAFWYCMYLYPLQSQDTEFWMLRTNIYAMLICMCFYLVKLCITDNNKLHFIMSIGMGFSVSDVIDRVCFDIRIFTKEDVWMIVLTISIAAYEYRKRRLQHSNKN